MNRTRAVLLAVLAAFAFVLAPPAPAQVQVPINPNKIPMYAQDLPLLTNGIDLVGGPAVNVSMCEFEQQVLPPGTPLAPNTTQGGHQGMTWVWGYVEGGCGNLQANRTSYLGPVIVALRNTPTQVTYTNSLGDTSTTQVLAYKNSTDQTLMWADPLNGYYNPITKKTSLSEANDCAKAGGPAAGACLNHYAGPIPAAPHLHGGEIPAFLDGGPDAWWTGTGLYGHGYYSKGGVGDAANGQAVYTYPNVQEAAPTWFHDHVLGATRLNVYAGIAGAYVQVDPRPGNFNYPADKTLPTAAEIIPIVIQDRMFDTTGQLYFPALGINPEHPFWVPEFIGDTIVVNGKAWPRVNVERKRYRFLFLNGSNARTYELYLFDKVMGFKGPAMYVIGNDQGYLDAPAVVDPKAKTNQRLLIMPGERYEVIIDFAKVPTTTTQLELINTAKAPYPAGAPPSGRMGRIMQFLLGPKPATDPTFDPAAASAKVRVADFIKRLVNPTTGTLNVTQDKTRRLTLNEFLGAGGPLEILVNNTKYLGDVNPNGGAPRGDFTKINTMWNTTYYSELPQEGETEVWEIVNLTADAHPIHPHLVAFQILNRQAFDVKGYNALYNGLFPGGAYMAGVGPPLDYNTGTAGVLGGNPDPTPFFLAPARPPTPAEVGWKDTVVAYPGEVTRIVIRFAPTNTPLGTKGSYAFNPNGGHGYVWHCHIIDHEDNEMMRPFSVVPKAGATRTFTAY